ncbi:MAG: FimB/Mfa2 family fimbrial subunit [Alistipes sp.]
MLKRISRGLILIGLLFAVSCIKEDVSNCGADVQVQYYYTLNPQQVNLFEQKVQQMGIYIFDGEGLYYDYRTINDPAQIRNNQPIRFKLPTGDYTLLSWGGTPDWYDSGERTEETPFQFGLRKGVTRLSDFRLWIQWYKAGGEEHLIAKEPADLYHGQPTQIKVGNDRATATRIGLIKNTHTINVLITGIEFLLPNYQPGQSLFDIYCIGGNGRYQHDNTFDKSAETVKYLPSSNQFVDNQVIASIKVMRMISEEPFWLTVADKHSGEVYFKFDMMPYIMQLPAYMTQEDIDREDEFDIKLQIGMDLSLVIWINGWKLIDVIPQ